MRLSLFSIAVVASASLAALPAAALAGDDEESSKVSAARLHDDFEGPRIAWEREHTDTTINLIAQERSPRAAQDGTRSERFQFESEPGSQFFVSYPLPKVPVTDALTTVLHVRANRVGVQLYGRVVLPEDVDPETRAPSFLLIQGTSYERVDRWQRLELTHMLPSIERQARVLRASSRRPVSLKGAYLDRVVVNLMGGPGASEVFLDNLSVSPIPADLLEKWTKNGRDRPAQGSGPVSNRRADGKAGSTPIVRLQRNSLQRLADDRKYHDWLPTAIDAPGADPATLRRYGFDVLVDDRKSDPGRIKAAIEKGFFLMPRLRLNGAAAGTDPQQVLADVDAYPFKDAVAFWQVGEGLGRKRDLKKREEELDGVRRVVTAMRQLPAGFSRLTTAVVDGNLPLYARAPGNLDTIGIQPLLWASGQPPLEGREFLNQRRRLTALANPRELFWAWIPAAAPPLITSNIWGEDVPPSWGVPQVSPAQLRLMTYLALSTGYRGLGYLGDAELTRPGGRPLLIEMAFLNEEIDLCESILARSSDPIPVYGVFDPDPPNLPPPGSLPGTKIRTQKEFAPKKGLLVSSIAAEQRGALLLVVDYADNAQYEAPQMAYRNLIVRAILPESAQAFLISPGEVKLLPRNRTPFGTEITIDEFDTTAMILCTTDLGLKDRVEAALARVRPLAVQLAIEQAEALLRSTLDVNGRLNADGHHLITPKELKRRADSGVNTRATDERDLLMLADAMIKSARDAREREDFSLAWNEARRAVRPLRVLRYGHWQNAFSELVKAVGASFPETPRGAVPIPVLMTPACCGPAIGFNTLPELFFWIDWIGGGTGYRFGANRLPSGSFDDPQGMAGAGWVNLDYPMDGITAKSATMPRDGSESDRMIRMVVEPVKKAELDKNVPFFDFPIAAIRSPAIPVQAKNLIRISVQVKRPIASNAGIGGVIVRDSIGGEQLQFRSAQPIPSFSRVVLYRKAPADGTFTVTLGLAGYGEAFFDDLRVELVEGAETPSPPETGEIASQPPNRRASPTRPANPDPDPSRPSATVPAEPRTRRR